MLRYIIMHCPNFLLLVNLSNHRHLMQVIHFHKSIAYLALHLLSCLPFLISVNCEFFVSCVTLHVYHNERSYSFRETIESNSFDVRYSCGKSQEMVSRADDSVYSDIQVVLR